VAVMRAQSETAGGFDLAPLPVEETETRHPMRRF